MTQKTPRSGNNLQTMGLLDAPNASKPLLGAGGGDIVIKNDEALVAHGRSGMSQQAMSDENGQIRIYSVKPSDTLSQIADMFDVSVNTIRWQNNIGENEAIQPGQDLVILPITGVQHTVEDGDTVSEIADEYDAKESEIRDYNNIATADSLSQGQEIIIPSGEMGRSEPASPGAGQQRRQPSGGTQSVDTGRFAHPAPNSVVTQRLHGYNSVDFGSTGPVRAAQAGRVIISRRGWNGGYGNYLVVDHGDGVQTLYSHNRKNLVGVGSYVERGQKIAVMGQSGKSTGVHLHFEVRGAKNPFRNCGLRSSCR